MNSRITTSHTINASTAVRRFGLGEPHRTAQEARAILRHPRSLIRITPGWRAPSFYVGAGESTAVVHISRRRMSPLMWRRLSQSSAPTGQELFLVTASVEGPRWMTHSSARLLELILGQAWIVKEDPQEFRDNDHQRQVRLTWHALMTKEDLRAGDSSTPQVA